MLHDELCVCFFDWNLCCQVVLLLWIRVCCPGLVVSVGLCAGAAVCCGAVDVFYIYGITD